MGMMGMYLTILVVMFILLGIATLGWIKLMAHGKVVAVFFDTRRIYSMLLKEDVAGACVWRGKEDNPNREKYKLVAEKVFELGWPGGFPWFAQERLRAWVFVRGNSDPYDPSNMRIIMSSRMNRMVSDEALLRTMWRDLRQSVGVGGGPAGPMSLQMLLFLGFIALIAALDGLMTYNLGKKMDTMYSLLIQVYHLLGGR